MTIPDSFLYSQLYGLMKYVVLAAVVILLVMTLLMKRIIARTVRPIKSLSDAMCDSNLKQLKMAASDENVKEIAQLTNSYNKMIQNTDQLILELEQEEMKKKDAEYEALIQQIKPHFLYNTLEIIQSMCLDYDNEELEDSIGLLADFFRSSLNQGRMLVTLKEELHQVEDYLKLQLLRDKDKFTYEIHDATGGNNLFMKFTLQPIVENAIYHGVKYSSGHEYIWINCSREKNHLRIIVENTCESYDAEKIERINQLFQTEAEGDQYPGYGLYNVYKRLKLHYGMDCRMQIEGTAVGVRVTVLHPVIVPDDEGGNGSEYIDSGRRGKDS